MKLILASSSPRRIEILKKLVTDFEVQPADLEEILDSKKSAKANVERLATAKTRAVFEQNSLTLGCDTLGELDDWVFGKPKSKKEAVEFLKKLSGKTHSVISGFCVKTNEKEIIGSETTEVTFRKIKEGEIEKYVAENPVTNWAGGYAIQGAAKKFVEKVEGEIETVIGFPLSSIKKILATKN
ncbi:Maf family protein [Candidatus Gracilibacteria bacterium]|nr:Maf family protein [Candidatus Gracilibacteria bacterium]MCF7856462.1 Maf family protein [Candidatus Gracilibacteria bacterium]MCF7896758.1 Maf family protein [Candidatus Gracilibacteria bacterium]